MEAFNKKLIGGSAILLATFGLYNVFNYIFHFSMARLLTIAEYGTLATLFSIMYLFGIFSESVQTVIVKYTAQEPNEGKLKTILKKSLAKGYRVSTFLFVVYLVIAIPLSFVLQIMYPLLALNGLMIFAMLLLPVTRGVLQGRKKFVILGANMIFESIVKLIIAVSLVFIGWKVYGAIIATSIGAFAAFTLSLGSLKNIWRAKQKPADTGGIYAYSKPVFFLICVIFAFYSLDIIIAKIVFDPQLAGAYALASTLAKTIFLGTQPISRAMFPLTAQPTKKGPSQVRQALILLVGCLVIALIIFYFFPSLLIRIFAGRYIPESAQIVLYLAIGTSLLSLTNLAIFYKLSQGMVKNYWSFAVFVILQVVLLMTFSANLVQFSLAFITSAAIFLWGTLFLLSK